MINLCLVVIATQFSETKQREHQLMQEQRARYLSSSTVASYMEPGDCYEEIFQYVCHIVRKAKRRTLGLYNSIQSRRQGHVEPSNAKLGMNRKSQRHYSKDCVGKAGNTNSGNVRVAGSISTCQLKGLCLQSTESELTLAMAVHQSSKVGMTSKNGNETGMTGREREKPRDHNGITLKALAEACKGLQGWYSRVSIAVWERDVLGEYEQVGLRVGLCDTAGPPELSSQAELLWALKREAKGVELQ